MEAQDAGYARLELILKDDEKAADVKILESNKEFDSMLKSSSNSNPLTFFSKILNISEESCLSRFEKIAAKKGLINYTGAIDQIEGQWSFRVLGIANDTLVFFIEGESSLENNEKQELDKYNRFFEIASENFIIAGSDGTIIEVNKQFPKTLGYKLDQIRGKNFLDFVHPDDIDSTISEMKKLDEGIPTFSFCNRYRTKSGDYRHLQWNSTSNEGRYYAVARDMTAEVNSEIEKKNSEARYRTLINSAADAIYLADEKFMIIEANDSASRITGYSNSELLKMSIKDLHDGTVDPKKITEKIGENNLLFETTHIGKDGRAVPVEINVGTVDLFGKKYFLAIVRDLTSTKTLANRFVRIFEKAPYGIALVSPEGKPTMVNDQLCKDLGYSQMELTGMTFEKFTHPEDFKIDMDQYQQLVNGDIEEYSIEKRFIHKTGKVVFANLKVTLLDDQSSAGETVALAMVENVNRRKKIEITSARHLKELNEAQKIAELGSWSLDVIHDELIWSDEIYRIFGAKPKSFEGTVEAFYSFVHPDERQKVQDYFNECVAEKKDYEITHRIVTKNGELKYVKEKATFEYDEEANLLVAHGTVQDITKTELYQQELSLRDYNLKKFFEYVDIGIARNAMDGSFIEINPEFERFTGYTVDELNKMSYWDLTPEKYAKQEEEQLKSLSETGRYGPYRKEYITKEEKLLPVLLSGVRTEDANGDQYIWSIVQDISKRVSNEKKLKQDVEKFKLLLETGNLIAFEVDLKSEMITTIREENQINDKHFPISEMKSFGDFFDIIRDPHRNKCRAKLDRLIQKEYESFSCDMQIRKDDKFFWHQGILAVLEVDEDENPSKVFVTLRNIEEEKNQEIRDIVNQEMERLRISRDIHDSIGQMLVGTRLTLRTQFKESEELAEIDELLDEMIKESRMIINNFGISLKDDDNLKESFINLAQKMNKVYPGKIEILWEGPEKIHDLKTATNIFRIYQETLSNAIKYSESPKITISVKNDDSFSMVIKDFGVGYDTSSVREGFGTQNIKERAKEIGGKIIQKSELMKGTEILLTID